MRHYEKLALIRQSGVIAILRANSSAQLIAAAEAVRAGGVRAIEVTMTTPGALRVIEEAVARFGDEVLFGAGTVLDAGDGARRHPGGGGLPGDAHLQPRRSCACAGATACRSCRAAPRPPRCWQPGKPGRT